MLKKIYFASLVAAVILLGSCMGSPSTVGSTSKLAKYEVGFIVGEETLGAPISIDPFWKVSGLYDIMDSLELHAKLDLEGKGFLMDVLFGDLPAKQTMKLLREIRIGKYFANGSDLSIRYMAVDLKKSPENAGVERMFLFFSNAARVKVAGKSTVYVNVGFEDLSNNIAWGFCQYDNGRFVEFDNVLNDDNFAAMKKAAGTDLAREAIFTAEFYTLDQDEGNDAEVLPLLEPLLADESTDDEAMLMASITLFRFRLLQGELAMAEDELARAGGLLASVSDDYLEEVVKIQAPAMFDLMSYE